MRRNRGPGRPGRLILHIGTQKTGSTSFQESLKSNTGKLAARGIGTVSETFTARDGQKRERYNLAALSDLFIRREVPTIYRVRHGAARPKSRIGAAWLRARWALALWRRPERDLVLSAEAFCFLRNEKEARKMRRFLALTRRRIVILLVTRNETDWRASWNAQIAKHRQVSRKLANTDSSLRIDADWFFDLSAIRDFWSALGELREIDFDAAVAEDGNIVPRLYREAGIDEAGLDMDVRLNTRAGTP